MSLSEAETRKLIDEQLRKAGWEVDTPTLRHSKGTCPKEGRYIAIAEWPVGKLWADYALFYEHELIGIVEAKKFQKDIVSDLTQAKEYSKLAEGIDGAHLLGKWNSFNVPFLFSSNGRNYNQQLPLKSGIWFLDSRIATNHPRPLRGFYTPEGLHLLFNQNLSAATSSLENEPFDYLRDPNALGLREYQIKAIKAVEEKIESNKDDRRALIAMATGTGKTRTIVGLCYRLIKSKIFKRILFLVDRNILGTQANDAFKDIVIEDLQTFSKIYDVKELGETTPEIDTKIHFSTVQAMVHRIYKSEKPEDVPPIDAYDCIIIDEAHRGYTLDKEMTEEEIEFKNEADYLSKYKMVLDYFDAYKIGMTATPALHTIQIFGKPVFRYSYRRAVIEGFLVDYEPPYNIHTKLSNEGIKWEKGERPKAFDRETQEVEKLDALADELKIDIEGFNKEVITESFNRVVCEQLVEYLDPDSPKKTLIFAANDDHADLVVKVLNEEFQKKGIDVYDEAIMKITGSVYEPQKQVNKFKNEKYPSIVVTVDLLTTGVDVEEICNLVFLRLVRSRILYDQMIGRATRKADHIDKEVFKIYDAVRLYDSLKDFTEMKPVVVKPDQSFQELIGEIKKIKTKKQFKKQIDELVAKLQRKKKKIQKNIDIFKVLSGGLEPADVISNIRKLELANAADYFKKYQYLFKKIDEMKGVPAIQLISEHKDEIQTIERGYGKGKKPQDYLNEFRVFIKENMNTIAALNILCTRPKDLTRAELKKLILQLDEAGFSKTNLNIAWKETKNVDITADLIAFIRTFALGSALISHEERIKNAIKKVKTLKQWNATQVKWLDQIEKQLLKEEIIDREAFEEEPFKRDGGYTRLNKIFENKLDDVVNKINDYLYSQSA